MLPPNAGRDELASARGFSLAELLVALTATAMLCAIASQVEESTAPFQEAVAVPAALFSGIAGAVIGGISGYVQQRRVFGILLAISVGYGSGVLGGLALLVRLSWPHVVLGSFIVCAAALVCRLISPLR